MRTHKIALYPGDGIGPEVLDASLEVIEAARLAVGGFQLVTERFDWGMPYYERHGRVVPDDFLTTMRTFDAIFLARSAGPRDCPTASHLSRCFSCARHLDST